MGRFARGIIITLLGAALWGFSGTCSQYLFQHYAIAPLLVTVIRMLGAAAAFLVTILVTEREKVAAILRDAPTRRSLVVFGCLGLFLVQVTYVVTVSLTNAGTATVLQALNIVFCMLAAFVTERRGPRTAELLAFAAAFTATVLVATGGNLSSISISTEGLAWGLATAAAAAVYITYPKRMFARWGSFPITGLGMRSRISTTRSSSRARSSQRPSAPGFGRPAAKAQPHPHPTRREGEEPLPSQRLGEPFERTSPCPAIRPRRFRGDQAGWRPRPPRPCGCARRDRSRSRISCRRPRARNERLHRWP